MFLNALLVSVRASRIRTHMENWAHCHCTFGNKTRYWNYGTLGIELGRYSRSYILWHERLCAVCEQGEIGDECQTYRQPLYIHIICQGNPFIHYFEIIVNCISKWLAIMFISYDIILWHHVILWNVVLVLKRISMIFLCTTINPVWDSPCDTNRLVRVSFFTFYSLYFMIVFVWLMSQLFVSMKYISVSTVTVIVNLWKASVCFIFNSFRYR